ncbi:MAG: MnhB domain-containing protein [Devosia sp.]
MNTLILRTMTPILVTLIVPFSVIVVLRGHNSAGGGFIGGLIAAGAVAIHGMAFGTVATRRLLRIDPLLLSGIGVLIAALSGLPSALFGDAYLTGIWLPAHAFGTPGVFDIGVYLVVFGMLSAVILGLEDGEGEA